ncbi:MAG: hypothetical protein ACFFDT_11835 [Candidatus Hodarchaeota archaeon]
MVRRQRTYISRNVTGGTILLPSSNSDPKRSKTMTEWYWECPKCGNIDGF